ncbi:DUF3703 domain-containing protein [Streptomyces sp. SID13666]|uniref:DUF3703 domain-containing protein n=1 Tax=unclassified Streptomyces TaxID=2593676 RepID=UPI0013BFB6E4|nr:MULTISPECIES: DUF3703 domain-containing protein [unclassified Streptomyces]NEA54617.1 DUF3703 domain-containing protein [Streptomyces sp. SID13666]NEA70406.1 DUF3703 domain-containing protein [Streptomyces sp. SID13588]
MSESNYESAMRQGHQALTARDFRSAYRRFGQAHNIGHDVLAHHLAAHRALATTAWRQRPPDRVASQIFLYGMAALSTGPEVRAVRKWLAGIVVQRDDPSVRADANSWCPGRGEPL